MKNAGKQFESDFINSFPNDIYTYRLRDSAGAWGSDTKDNKTRFTAKNICDFIVCHTSTMFLELKSTSLKSLPFSNISKNQVNEMKNASRYSNVVPLFIFNFRSVEQTFAISAEKVFDFYHNGDRKSFSLEWVRENGILIPQKLKRTRYEYDVTPILKD